MNRVMNSRSELEDERLKVLEKMIFYQLNKAKESILNGEISYQEIKTGHMVEANRKVNILRRGNRPFDNLKKVNDCRFIGCGTDENFKKLLLKSMNPVVENLNTGEHEATEMFIQWSGYALIRFDVYCYRCNFSSNEVVKNFEGAIGVITIKRTINLIITDPQTLASKILDQVINYPKKTTDIINEVVTIINKIRSTANRLEYSMPISCIHSIDNKCHLCCKFLRAYANPAKTCTRKTKRVKNKKRKQIKKQYRKRKYRKKK